MIYPSHLLAKRESSGFGRPSANPNMFNVLKKEPTNFFTTREHLKDLEIEALEKKLWALEKRVAELESPKPSLSLITIPTAQEIRDLNL